MTYRTLACLFVLLCIDLSDVGAVLAQPEQAPADVSAPKPFPLRGLLPKEEIGALRFLEKHPEYDGRGVVVAVFDTGVDPGAAGLDVTPDGRPKVIEMIDGTGSGDVETSTVVEATDAVIQGLTGRTLKLDPAWKNPKNRWRIGKKTAYDFFPGTLISRLKKERRKKFFDKHRRTEADLLRQIARWDEAPKNPTAAEKKLRADLDARLEALRKAGKSFDDPGPIFDCVVFHDGGRWRAIVDTDEDGDLAEETLLSNFRLDHEYASFENGALLNFAANIYENGNVLSLVADSGPHGTHVAGIVGAYYPDHPELSGVAPGVQIVSVKIGDPRLGGMETGPALIRGLKAVLDHKCDLINMSFGEMTGTPNRGRLIELFSEIVNEHGVIFVSSAGNSGPALSTVGAPGGTSSAVLGVGAYVSPAMMKAAYALRGDLTEMPYTWTSRGPAADGDLGVDIFAPGGAIAPVPNWTLTRNMRMNGTSMASSNACGGIALLLSGMKPADVAYSPHSVRRAIQNTARVVEAAEVFARGPGLLQVDAAFEHLLAYADCTGERVRIDVTLPGRDNARGVYLREPHEVARPLETAARIRPVFREKDAKRSRIDFEMRIALEATADWIKTGEHFLLNHGGASVPVLVAPTGLVPGVHYAEIRGYDADNRERGPMFRLPVTVVKPEFPTRRVPDPEPSTPRLAHHTQAARIDASTDAAAFDAHDADRTAASNGLVGTSAIGRFAFQPGDVVRRFFAVPRDATWVDVSLRLRSNDADRRRFVMQAVQLTDDSAPRHTDVREYVTLAPGAESVKSIPVAGGATLELCIAHYWSSPHAAELEYVVNFRGLTPDDRAVSLSAAEPVARVRVTAASKERLAPSARLTTLRRTFAPAKAVVRALDSNRDRLPDGRPLYELQLTYRFEMDAAANATPRFPWNDDLLYGSAFGSHLYSIYDSDGRRVVTNDVFPDAVKLRKGPHELRLTARHGDPETLNKLKTAPFVLDAPLKKTLTVKCYKTRPEALADGTEFKSRTLDTGETAALVVRAPSLPKTARAGDVLTGVIHYGGANALLGGSEQRPDGYPLEYLVQVGGATAATAKTGSSSAAEGVDDSSEDPLKVLAARLHKLDTLTERKKHLKKVVEAADDVIDAIDADAIRNTLADRADADDDAEKKARKGFERRREILIDALYRKGRALGYMELPDVLKKHPITDPDAHDSAFESNFKQLARWVDPTEKDYVLLYVRRERRKERYGNALKQLNRHIAESPPNYWYYKKRRDVYQKLGWEFLAVYEHTWLMIRYPHRIATP